MIHVLRSSWALLLGMFLLQIGNGLQGSLMGVRGAIEGFSTFQISLIASAYFVGFLGGSRFAPIFIAKVGHVRVFAALGSLISATLISYPVLTDPYAWMVLRVVLGFSLSGVYVTAESWLNDAATNETRGQSLSAYVLCQMVGLVAAQGILSAGDPTGWLLFIIPSILVSLSFAPILLSVQPAPAFAQTSAMSLKALYKSSPFGVVGMCLMGSVFAGQFAMAAVFATEAGLSLGQLAAFSSTIFIGGIIFQYPIGWLSDRMDRRVLIVSCAAVSGCICLVGLFFGHIYPVLLAVGVLSGGLSQPLYALLIAYTNDYLSPQEMPAASGGLLFVNGLGAIAGPPVMGLVMGRIGAQGFWLVLAMILFATALYGVWRMTQRASAYAVEEDSYDAVPYANLLPGAASPVAVEAAQGLYVEAAEVMAEEQQQDAGEETSTPRP
ncbi:MFS transporter [Roseicyclus marinus]|uniref:MFS transporter n=1 Tax=Roseicyclus marinus TaxID=2161673 RepID=UPI00240EC2D1|nr:MFS transporter [Roseicyclus marinus]MDG3040306.1 MFS transporter [Roseicyclus marinus]